MGSDDNEQDDVSYDAARSNILSAEVFDSESVPSPNSFLRIYENRAQERLEVMARQRWYC